MSSRIPYVQDLFRLAGPLIIAQMGYAAFGVVDTMIAGRAGALVQAGTGLGGNIFFCISLFTIGLALGLDPLISQAMGANNKTYAKHMLWQGAWGILLMCIPLMGLLLGLRYALIPLGIEPSVAVSTQQYLDIRWFSMPALALCGVFRSYLQATRQTKPIVLSVIVANLVNGGLGVLLVHRMGSAGLALSATVATFVQAIGLGIPVWRDAKPNAFQYHANDVRAFYRVALPVASHIMAEVTIFSLVSFLMGRMTPTIMAAHQSALMVAHATFSMCFGIASAASVQVGWALGAEQPQEAKQRGILALQTVSIFMGLTALIMGFFPESLAKLMTTDPDVITIACQLLQIGAIFQLADGIQCVASGCLRGTGKTTWPFMATLIAHWVIGFPIGIVLTYVLKIGPAGLWWGLTAGLAVVAVALTFKFISLFNTGTQHVFSTSSGAGS